MEKNLTKLVLTSLFAAMVCVATMVIHIRIPATGGYINIGDTIVLLCAWIIGGMYGGIAAGVGSMLADILLQAPEYAPATLVIKFLMAVTAYYIFMAIKKANLNKVVGYIVSGIAAEIIMVAGYFLYESIILGFGLGAAAGILGNLVQGGACLVLGYATILVLESTKAVNTIKKYV